MRTTSLRAILCAGILSLSACGGGTTPSPSPVAPPPPPPPPPPNFNTAEYQRNWGLDGINALPAYEAGLSGEGIIVGVVDTGVDENHSDLVGQIHSASRDIITSRPTPTLDDPDGHGTIIAGIIAASKNDIGVHGVAFNAQVLMVRADIEGSCAEPDGCSFFDSDLAIGIDFAVANGAKIINLSLGGDAIDPVLVTAMQNAIDAGVLLVIASGNESTLDPSVFAQFALAPGVDGRVIIVGAIDQNNVIADFSNLAGVGQNVYVVAPGVKVISTFIDNQLAEADGTSFAAPHVAGAAAVLFEMFPSLTAAEVADILFTTAVDLGVAGIDAIYGHGLIDLGAAIQPLGVASISIRPLGVLSDVPLAGSGIEVSPAFGDAFGAITPLGDVMMLDGYRRSYIVDLTSSIRQRSLEGLPLFEILEDRRGRGALELSLAPGNSLAFAFYDPAARDREIMTALPMAEQTSRQLERPSAFFEGKIGDQDTLAMGYGFEAGYLLDRTSGRRGKDSTFIAPGISSPVSYLSGRNSSAMGFGHIINERLSVSGVISLAKLSRQDDVLFGRNPVSARVATAITRLSGDRGALWFDLDVGVMAEWNAVLGSISNGALQIGEGARTFFGSATIGAEIGKNLRIEAMFNHGLTMVDGGTGSLVESVSNLRTMSFSAALYRDGMFRPDDRVGLAVAAPLRVESGNIGLVLPSGRDYDRDEILFSSYSAPLSPTHREIDVEFSYRLVTDGGTTLEANVIQRFNAGHSTLVGNETAVLLHANRRF